MTPRPVLALLLVSLSALPVRAACGGAGEKAHGIANVAGIADGRTLRLADGRDLVLAGIEVDSDRPNARLALEKRALGQPVRLAGLTGPDRYGRYSAYVLVNGAETPLQYSLLREGAARVAARVSDSACRAALLGAERSAQAGGFGLWGDRVYDIGQADNPETIRAGRGRFAVVQGQVLSVRESAGTIYVNFGRRWSEDFTATIPKRLERNLSSAGLAPKSLSGRIVRVRGIVEERRGPWIEVTHAGQIELAQQ